MTSQFKSLRNKNSVYENEPSELIDDFLIMRISYKNKILRRLSFSEKKSKPNILFIHIVTELAKY